MDNTATSPKTEKELMIDNVLSLIHTRESKNIILAIEMDKSLNLGVQDLFTDFILKTVNIDEENIILMNFNPIFWWFMEVGSCFWGLKIFPNDNIRTVKGVKEIINLTIKIAGKQIPIEIYLNEPLVSQCEHLEKEYEIKGGNYLVTISEDLPF